MGHWSTLARLESGHVSKQSAGDTRSATAPQVTQRLPTGRRPVAAGHLAKLPGPLPRNRRDVLSHAAVSRRCEAASRGSARRTKQPPLVEQAQPGALSRAMRLRLLARHLRRRLLCPICGKPFTENLLEAEAAAGRRRRARPSRGWRRRSTTSISTCTKSCALANGKLGLFLAPESRRAAIRAGRARCRARICWPRWPAGPSLIIVKLAARGQVGPRTGCTAADLRQASRRKSLLDHFLDPQHHARRSRRPARPPNKATFSPGVTAPDCGASRAASPHSSPAPAGPLARPSPSPRI